MGLQPGMLIEWDFKEDQTAKITLSKVDEHRSWAIFSTLLYEESDQLPPQGAELVFPGATPDGN